MSVSTSEDISTQHETHYQGSTHGCSSADWSPSGRLGMRIIDLSEATIFFYLFSGENSMYVQNSWIRLVFRKVSNFGTVKDTAFVQGRIEELETDVANAKTFELQAGCNVEAAWSGIILQRVLDSKAAQHCC